MKPRKKKRTDEQLDAIDADFRVAFVDLMTGWSTCESHLRPIFTKLLGSDGWRADLVMYSMTSSRARAEIIQRMATLLVPNKRKVAHLQKLLREFKAVTTLRNRLAHSVYAYKRTDGSPGLFGAVTDAIYVNFAKATFDGGGEYEKRDVDRGLIHEMEQMALRAVKLSHRFERVARTLQLRKNLEPRQSPPSSQREGRKSKAPHGYRGKPQKRKRPS